MIYHKFRKECYKDKRLEKIYKKLSNNRDWDSSKGWENRNMICSMNRE